MVRYVFMLLESHRIDEASKVVQDLLLSMGDEKLIEDVHQHVRDLERHQRHGMRDLTSRFAQMILSPVLSGKYVEEVRADEAQVVQNCIEGSTMPLAKSLDVKLHAARTPPAWQKILGQRTWDSPSPESLWQSLAAWKWIINFWAMEVQQQETTTLESAWMSNLLVFKDVVLDESDGSYYFILAPAPWSSLVLSLVELESNVLTFSNDARPLRWLSVHKGNLNLMSCIPYHFSVCSRDGHAGRPVTIILEDKEPLTLAARALQAGVTMSQAQLTDLWLALTGGSPCPMSTVLESLLHISFPDDESMQTARQNFTKEKKSAEEILQAKLKESGLMESVLEIAKGEDPDNHKEWVPIQKAQEHQKRREIARKLAMARSMGAARASQLRRERRSTTMTKRRIQPKNRPKAKGKAKSATFISNPGASDGGSPLTALPPSQPSFRARVVAVDSEALTASAQVAEDILENNLPMQRGPCGWAIVVTSSGRQLATTIGNEELEARRASQTELGQAQPLQSYPLQVDALQRELQEEVGQSQPQQPLAGAGLGQVDALEMELQDGQGHSQPQQLPEGSQPQQPPERACLGESDPKKGDLLPPGLQSQPLQSPDGAGEQDVRQIDPRDGDLPQESQQERQQSHPHGAKRPSSTIRCPCQ